MLLFMLLSLTIVGQEKKETLEGKVSFVTSKNIYVKFGNTENIKIGDTLRTSDSRTPCLIVTHKSSNSVVCATISNCKVNKDDSAYYTKKIIEDNSEIEDDKNLIVNQNENPVEIKDEKIKESLYKENIKSKISVASYSTLSDIRENRHSIMSRFSLYANHISDSKFSFDTYLNYRQNFLPESSTSSLETNIFRLYDLALRYDANPTLSITVGRKINPKTSSLGAIDGLQVEQYFNKNYIGVIAGFRPDIFDYNFNSDLFEYGAYYGRKTDAKNFYSETTVGFLEQRNTGAIDRRYTYLQHSSTIFKKLYLFSSLELDIYNKVNEVARNDFRLTNLYASVRYRFSRSLDATLSYDSRKRILYYETLQTEIERLINDDISRQGIRMRVNVKPMENVFAGFSYSKRFQSDNDNKSDNIYIYLGLSKVPFVGGRLSLNYNINTSNYLESNILSLRHSSNLLKNKLSADVYYRLVNYIYLNSNAINSEYKQNFYGANLSYHLSRRFTISVYGELSNSNQENNYRIYTKLSHRFYKKKKHTKHDPKK